MDNYVYMCVYVAFRLGRLTGFCCPDFRTCSAFSNRLHLGEMQGADEGEVEEVVVHLRIDSSHAQHFAGTRPTVAVE